MRVPARSLSAVGRCTGEGGVSLALLGVKRAGEVNTHESPRPTPSLRSSSAPGRPLGKVRTGFVSSQFQPHSEPALRPRRQPAPASKVAAAPGRCHPGPPIAQVQDSSRWTASCRPSPAGCHCCQLRQPPSAPPMFLTQRLLKRPGGIYSSTQAGRGWLMAGWGGGWNAAGSAPTLPLGPCSLCPGPGPQKTLQERPLLQHKGPSLQGAPPSWGNSSAPPAQLMEE